MTDWLWSLYWFLLTLFWMDMWLIQLLITNQWKKTATAWEEVSNNWKQIYFDNR